ncbi:MAG: GntR family transcriptional regulator [Woeseiaceae bacterium]|nr:GntR family transcriptional regulator [Woeseiaceae bacterium]
MPRKTIDIAPLEKPAPLAEQIVRQLLELIGSGELAPGDRLPAERKLAQDLGVGRPTLREALRALQLLGLLDIRHGGGVYVTASQPDALLGPLHLFVSLDEDNLPAVLEARKIIEGAVLAHVARTIDERAIARLQANLAEFEELLAGADDGEPVGDRYHELAQRFRAIIEDAAGNPILTRAVLSLDVLSAAARKRLPGAFQYRDVLQSHKRIVAALAAHDSDAAREALEAHIDFLAAGPATERPDRELA